MHIVEEADWTGLTATLDESGKSRPSLGFELPYCTARSRLPYRLNVAHKKGKLRPKTGREGLEGE